MPNNKQILFGKCSTIVPILSHDDPNPWPFWLKLCCRFKLLAQTSLSEVGARERRFFAEAAHFQHLSEKQGRRTQHPPPMAFSAYMQLGNLWRRTRRHLPQDVQEAFVDLLAVCQQKVQPSCQKPVSVNLAEARAEVQHLVQLAKALASPVQKRPKSEKSPPAPTCAPLATAAEDTTTEAEHGTPLPLVQQQHQGLLCGQCGIWQALPTHPCPGCTIVQQEEWIVLVRQPGFAITHNRKNFCAAFSQEIEKFLQGPTLAAERLAPAPGRESEPAPPTPSDSNRSPVATAPSSRPSFASDDTEALASFLADQWCDAEPTSLETLLAQHSNLSTPRWKQQGSQWFRTADPEPTTARASTASPLERVITPTLFGPGRSTDTECKQQ